MRWGRYAECVKVAIQLYSGPTGQHADEFVSRSRHEVDAVSEAPILMCSLSSGRISGACQHADNCVPVTLLEGFDLDSAHAEFHHANETRHRPDSERRRPTMPGTSSDAGDLEEHLTCGEMEAVRQLEAVRPT